MNLRSAVSLSTLALALAACKPSARGLCASQVDCRDGSFCSRDGICLGPSTDCSMACGLGEICSNRTCVPLKPSLQIVLASGAVLSPSQAQVTVHVEAAASIPLHALVVNAVDANQQIVATGTVPASPGDMLVALGGFQPNFAGPVSVSAYVTWDSPSGASPYARAPMVQAILDDQPPNVTVFVPPASDDVQGWIPRTPATAEVRAQVDDGQGSGPDSATLTFDVCPAAVACTYAGAAQGGGSFSFQVPRMAQAAGVASALSFTVTAKDKGGNANKASGALQIDDSAPQIGALSLVTNGVTGEDNNTWFLGGPGAPAVEIALPVSDTGVGLGTVTASLSYADVVAGTTLTLTPVSSNGSKTHFRLPASAVQGREGQLRFTVTALDKLQHTASAPGFILVDAAPPTVSAPRVDYASANPPFATVCASGTVCGRGAPGAPDHLLRDDSATVSFDVTDCGVGVGAAPTATATSGGVTSSVTVSANSKSGTPCSASTNLTHHYSFTLSLPDVAAALDAPDGNGTSLVQLAASGSDQFGRVAQGKAAGGATSGDGLALVSLVRWRTQLAGPMTGSPALLPGTGQRQVAIGIAPKTGTPPNLIVLNPDGSQARSLTLSTPIAGDVAVGPSGNIYLASGAGSFNIVPPTGISVPQPCAPQNTTFATSPMITMASGAEIAVAAVTATGANVYAMNLTGSSCQSTPSALAGGGGNLTGVSGNVDTWFFPHGTGFTSAVQNGKAIDLTKVASFVGSAVLSAPSISSGTAVDAIFGANDKKIHRAEETTSLTPWQDVGTFPTPVAASAFPFSPVFDGTTIYAADDQGRVYGWLQSSGSLVAGWPRDATMPVSAPVLLQNGSLLVVRNDATVALVSPQGILRLVTLTTSFASQLPPSPAVDRRGLWGVAYAGDGAGWVAAIQLPALPVFATATVWPRPGRDSCNSRNAGSACQ